MRASDPRPRPGGDSRPDLAQVLAWAAQAATLLFKNGQTTRQTIRAGERLAAAFGMEAQVLPRWGEIAVRIEEGGEIRHMIVDGTPTAVDMTKVAATTRLIDDLHSGKIGAEEVGPGLEAVARLHSVSTLRFAAMAGAGAAALAVIFGATRPLEIILTALTAGVGGWIRRLLGARVDNPFMQPFAASLLAGAVGAELVHVGLTGSQLLVALCSCMVLVPGPHLLNGAIDLVRARIALGAARVAFACLIVLVICTGLLLGLGLGGESLAVAAPSVPVPFGYDVIAAGVAVWAYGTFFSMSWRTLPLPILIGMLAHGLRWALLTQAHASVEAGALAACLLVGCLATPLANRLRLPFSAFAFASVVSLIPGVFLFRMAAGFLRLAALGADAPLPLLLGTISDGATAFLLIFAMTLGIIVPKMVIEFFHPPEK